MSFRDKNPIFIEKIMIKEKSYGLLFKREILYILIIDIVFILISHESMKNI